MSTPLPRRIDLQISGLTTAQAYALAELCKRIGWTDARSNAVDDDQARDMINAMDRVRGGLEESGVFVR